jgi:hypothetical protein
MNKLMMKLEFSRINKAKAKKKYFRRYYNRFNLHRKMEMLQEN